MSETIPYYSPPVYDQRPGGGGLVAWGVILIVLGSISGCVSLLTPLVMFAPRASQQPRMPLGQAVGVLVLYGAVAAGLITIGIGSCRRRRWCRPIILSLGWPLAAIGILSVFALLACAEPMAEMISLQAAIQATTGPAGRSVAPIPARAVILGMGAFVAIFMVVLPGLMNLYYQKQSVREFLDWADPQPRWTDRCPVPVLGMSIAAALWTLWEIPTLFMGVSALFGRYYFGAPAVAVHLAGMFLWASVAVLVYQRRPLGWWIATIAWIVISSSYAVTQFIGDPAVAMRASGQGVAHPKLLVPLAEVNRRVAIFAVIGGLAGVGYLLWVRRFFNARNDSASSMSPTPPV